MNKKKELDASVIEAIHAGRTIDAIKRLRESQNLELKEAKEIVERYRQENHIERRTDSNHKAINTLLLLGLIGVGAYFLFKNIV